MKIFTFVSACIFVLGYFLYCKLENENHDLIMLLQICRDYRTQPFQLKYEQVLYKTRSEIGEYTPREFYSPRPSPYPQQGLFLAKGGGSVKNMAAAGAESLTTATPKSFPPLHPRRTRAGSVTLTDMERKSLWKSLCFEMRTNKNAR